MHTHFQLYACTYKKSLPIFLAKFSMLTYTYFAQNYSSIICRGLLSALQCRCVRRDNCRLVCTNWRVKQIYLVVQCAGFFCSIYIYISVYIRCHTAISNLVINAHSFEPFLQCQRSLWYTLHIASQQCIAFF